MLWRLVVLVSVVVVIIIIIIIEQFDDVNVQSPLFMWSQVGSFACPRWRPWKVDTFIFAMQI